MTVVGPSGESFVLIVTGLSGAGKSTALHALEDIGFFCVDNLPIPVMEATLAACEAAGLPRMAMGIDVRVRRFLEHAAEVIESVRVPGHREVDILFLDAADETLLRRFSSTRRPHPLVHDPGAESTRAIAVLDSIRVERERLSPLRARAKQVIDTTELSVHDLRRRVLEVYGPGAGAQPRMSTRVVSFGFKYGSPVDADLVLDVRFLPNPFFVAELRPLSGLDEPVKDFVLAAPDARTFLDKATDLLAYCLPRYEREGKSYLTVGIGCTGGQHRSVVLAEKISEEVSAKTGLGITVVHRDIDRDLSVTGESFIGNIATRNRNTMSMARGTFLVRNKLGLHARAAAKLTQLASRYPCDVQAGNDDQLVNAKSVMGLLLLCGSKGTSLVIEANGENAEEAVQAIGALIESRFGEEE